MIVNSSSRVYAARHRQLFLKNDTHKKVIKRTKEDIRNEKTAEYYKYMRLKYANSLCFYCEIMYLVSAYELLSMITSSFGCRM